MIRKGDMTETEFQVIKAFSEGATRLRDYAIQIHRAEIARTGKVRNSPVMRFMAEVDNPCPDYGLRFMYRQELADATERSEYDML